MTREQLVSSNFNIRLQTCACIQLSEARATSAQAYTGEMVISPESDVVYEDNDADSDAYNDQQGCVMHEARSIHCSDMYAVSDTESQAADCAPAFMSSHASRICAPSQALQIEPRLRNITVVSEPTENASCMSNLLSVEETQSCLPATGVVAELAQEPSSTYSEPVATHTGTLPNAEADLPPLPDAELPQKLTTTDTEGLLNSVDVNSHHDGDNEKVGAMPFDVKDAVYCMASTPISFANENAFCTCMIKSSYPEQVTPFSTSLFMSDIFRQCMTGVCAMIGADSQLFLALHSLKVYQRFIVWYAYLLFHTKSDRDRNIQPWRDKCMQAWSDLPLLAHICAHSAKARHAKRRMSPKYVNTLIPAIIPCYSRPHASQFVCLQAKWHC